MYSTNLISDKQQEKATVCDGNLNRKAGMSGTGPDHPTKSEQKSRGERRRRIIIIIKKR
jgi:hypothetical protein